ncbi:hypothetical protein BLL36_23710 [Pseudomonas cedrina subsp. cedrina]|uniref:Uncharacterized protein n=1 Tax=Pseudomonas cedrina subsp. cedrina TaxID=76762 RepID=A0A1V2K0E3_PSECE|nr:hypothetical protein BLL36_23710 [Pseudomonas cedrina subsp. cedrina]
MSLSTLRAPTMDGWSPIIAVRAGMDRRKTGFAQGQAQIGADVHLPTLAQGQAYQTPQSVWHMISGHGVLLGQ